MSAADDTAGESFRGLVLQLRGRTGLTQRELATRVGVHVSSLQGWEAGATYPSVASLQALIGVGMRAGGFTPEHESEEAEALWVAALRDAPRFRTPFDRAWFERLVAGRRRPVRGESDGSVAAPPSPLATSSGARRESWGEAPDVAGFLNRVSERALLRQWVLDEGSRVVALLGLGGIGKSLLATRVAHDLAPSFDRVFWRSLRDAPTTGEWLAEAVRFLAPDAARESGGESALLRRLLERLGETRCLLVLDNVETVLQPGAPMGGYRAGYEQYGTLLRQVAEAPHQSCLVVTSREEPAEIRPLLGERGPVRALKLAGLGTDDGRALLHDKQLDGDEGAWQALVEHCGGNGLALRVVGETTRELFGGSIADFLEYASGMAGITVAGVHQLLHDQVERLSALEQDLLRRMAVAREPVGLMELAVELGPRTSRGATLEAMEGLRRRSLLERAERGPSFGLHSVVLEYVTEQLIEDIAHELEIGEPAYLLRQPLLKATAKDYTRRSQERLICAPLVERLVAVRGGVRPAEQWLIGLLDRQRGRPAEEQGYGPGNLVNLLRLLRRDLKGVDLSRLPIRQAYLQHVEAQGASLAGAHLSETVLGEAFSYPTSLALSADGAYLAVGTSSGDISCWRVADRTLLTTLPGHSGWVLSLALSADGRLLASSSTNGEIRTWEVEGGWQIATLNGHAGAVDSVALSADGRLVASTGVDGTIRFWEAASGRSIATLHGHTDGVHCVSVTMDGRLAASGGIDGSVRLWDTESGRPMGTLHGHTGSVNSVALSGDGRLVASGSLDGTARLWEVGSGRTLATLPGHSGANLGVALSRDGRLLASSREDGAVQLWQTERGQPQATIHGHTSGVRSLAMSGDGRLVASGSVDGTVGLWEAEGGRALAVMQGHNSGILSVALSRDSQLVVSGSVDGAIRLRDVESSRSLATLQGHTGGVRGVALSPDGRLVASVGVDGTVLLWEAGTGRTLAAFQGHTGGVCGVAMSMDGRLVASGGFDRTVRLWDAVSGRSLAVLRGHTGGVWGVALTGDGRLVASSSHDGTVRLWDTADGRPLATLDGHADGLWGVALSGDGRLVAGGGADGTVRLWDAADGRPLATLEGHVGLVYGVSLSGDGRLVASGGVDGTVRLWDAVGRQPLKILQGHTGAVRGVALSEDGQRIASGGIDGAVRLWAPSTDVCLRVLRDDRRYEHVDITGLTGVTEAQRQVLLALGAVERGGHTRLSS